MSRREKSPAPVVVKSAAGLRPMSRYDADAVFGDPVGTEYDLVKRTRRSRPQLRLYWSMLRRVVKATDRWATAEHLHDSIKLTLGYVKEIVNLNTGEMSVQADSAALDAMDPADFRQFFDRATELLASQLGFDPLAFLEPEATA